MIAHLAIPASKAGSGWGGKRLSDHVGQWRTNTIALNKTSHSNRRLGVFVLVGVFPGGHAAGIHDFTIQEGGPKALSIASAGAELEHPLHEQPSIERPLEPKLRVKSNIALVRFLEISIRDQEAFVLILVHAKLSLLVATLEFRLSPDSLSVRHWRGLRTGGDAFGVFRSRAEQCP